MEVSRSGRVRIPRNNSELEQSQLPKKRTKKLKTPEQLQQIDRRKRKQQALKNKHNVTSQIGRQRINEQIGQFRTMIPECQSRDYSKLVVLEIAVQRFKESKDKHDILLAQFNTLQNDYKQLLGVHQTMYAEIEGNRASLNRPMDPAFEIVPSPAADWKEAEVAAFNEGESHCSSPRSSGLSPSGSTSLHDTEDSHHDNDDSDEDSDDEMEGPPMKKVCYPDFGVSSNDGLPHHRTHQHTPSMHSLPPQNTPTIHSMPHQTMHGLPRQNNLQNSLPYGNPTQQATGFNTNGFNTVQMGATHQVYNNMNDGNHTYHEQSQVMQFSDRTPNFSQHRSLPYASPHTYQIPPYNSSYPAQYDPSDYSASKLAAELPSVLEYSTQAIMGSTDVVSAQNQNTAMWPVVNTQNSFGEVLQHPDASVFDMPAGQVNYESIPDVYTSFIPQSPALYNYAVLFMTVMGLPYVLNPENASTSTTSSGVASATARALQEFDSSPGFSFSAEWVIWILLSLLFLTLLSVYAGQIISSFVKPTPALSMFQSSRGNSSKLEKVSTKTQRL